MEKEIKNGMVIDWSNIENDLSATLSFSDKLNKFVVWFNGKIVISSKTFKPCLSKLEDLKNENDLTVETVD